MLCGTFYREVCRGEGITNSEMIQQQRNQPITQGDRVNVVYVNSWSI